MRVLLSLAMILGCAAARALADGRTVQVDMRSAALSAFWAQPVDVAADVLLPDSYDRNSSRRYPVIYVVPAFDGDYRIDDREAAAWISRMRGVGAEFIVVFLQAMVPIDGESLHQEFADSANAGPWGTALTSEFIPETDAHFRTIPDASARFLFGHSSGGWSVLWLQVNYPALFGGAWALSPDPVDFHDFFGPDLTKAPEQNFYHDAAGNEYGIDRLGRHDRATIRSFIATRAWMKRQIDTYDAVFGPRLADGKPDPLFDRSTGAIDATVAQYWEEHYDITHLIEERWSFAGPQLRGKIHVYVGTEDTFHLDGAVHLLQRALESLGALAEIEFAPGDNHWEIYVWHSDMISYAMSEMKASLAARTAAAR